MAKFSGVKMVEKDCLTCGKPLGLVAHQQKYCTGCSEAREAVREENRRLDRFRKTGRRRGVSGERITGENDMACTPPSPCDTNADGKETRCPNYKLCSTERLACRSYWQYSKIGEWGFRIKGGTRGNKWYLALQRSPNSGYYNASFCEAGDGVRRGEWVRLLDVVPCVFAGHEYCGAESFLTDRQKTMGLHKLLGDGLIGRVDDDLYENLTDKNPSRLARFLSGKHMGPTRTSAREGRQSEPAPQLDI